MFNFSGGMGDSRGGNSGPSGYSRPLAPHTDNNLFDWVSGDPDGFGFEDYDENDEFGGFGADGFGDQLPDGEDADGNDVDWTFLQKLMPHGDDQGATGGQGIVAAPPEMELVLASGMGDVDKVPLTPVLLPPL
jgi:hypothetical protein